METGVIRSARGIKGYTTSTSVWGEGSQMHLIPVVGAIIDEELMQFATTKGDNQSCKIIILGPHILDIGILVLLLLVKKPIY